MSVNGKQKGGEFERKLCKELSLWITDGKSIDCLWRSAMSGGRATVSKGKVRQAGDITAVSPEGHVLTDLFYIEAKHLKAITLDSLIKGNGELLTIWEKTKKEANRYEKLPALIFRKNHWPVVFCTIRQGISRLEAEHSVCVQAGDLYMVKFDDLVKLPFPLFQAGGMTWNQPTRSRIQREE